MTNQGTGYGRLIAAMRAPTPEMLATLSYWKGVGAELRERPDAIWYLLVQSMATQGRAAPWDKLKASPALLDEIGYDAIAALPREQRTAAFEKVFAAVGVRWPGRKASYMTTNFDRVRALGGPREARQRAFALRSRIEKIAFISQFAGIGDKYARNIWMDLYDPHFHDAIAVDERIKRITEALGLTFPTYEAHEEFYRQLARDAGMDAWDLDRLLFNYRDHFLAAIR